jgi:hypothetical protein
MAITEKLHAKMGQEDRNQNRNSIPVPSIALSGTNGVKKYAYLNHAATFVDSPLLESSGKRGQEPFRKRDAILFSFGTATELL